MGATSFYGDCHLVDFGHVDHFPEDMEQVAARCRRDGTKAEIMGKELGVQVRNTLLDHVCRRKTIEEGAA